MTPTSPWHPIDSAPRDGTPCLLFDAALELNASLPQDRRTHNGNAVVGRWHTQTQDGGTSHWVSDIRAIAFEGDQPFREASPLAPGHWMPLPAAPPDGPWTAAHTPPLAHEHVLLHATELTRTREPPLAALERGPPACQMSVWCHTDSAQPRNPLWLSDLCEADHVDDDPEDLIAVPARIHPTLWMALPEPPAAGT